MINKLIKPAAMITGISVFSLSIAVADGKQATVEAATYKLLERVDQQKILAFSKERVDRDHEDSLKVSQAYGIAGIKAFPRNKMLMEEVDRDFASMPPAEYSDVLLVEPQRSQMRSVLIFAAKSKAA